jgi:hypothetical protein
MNDETYERYSGGVIGGPVTCRTCGCRLAEANRPDGPAWEHFRIGPDTDARGCRPACLHLPHGRDGRVIGTVEGSERSMTGFAAAG